MEFNEDLASIHAYLCADGYVIRNPETQKQKYYHIGLRNTNMVLLKDFQKKFLRIFGVRPIIVKDGRCKVQSKEIYYILTKKFSYYSAKWSIPDLDDKCLARWLRSYFDCDGWVEVQKAKCRVIGLESINEVGLKEIQKALDDRFSIKSTVNRRKGRNIFFMAICGLDDIKKFRDNIGFLHPKKKKKIEEAIKSYKTYEWKINAGRILHLLNRRGRRRRGLIWLYSVRKSNLERVGEILNTYEIIYKIYGPCKSGQGSVYYYMTFKEVEFEKIRRKNEPKTKGY